MVLSTLRMAVTTSSTLFACLQHLSLLGGGGESLLQELICVFRAVMSDVEAGHCLNSMGIWFVKVGHDSL